LRRDQSERFSSVPKKRFVKAMRPVEAARDYYIDTVFLKAKRQWQ
jgi:hypothetical protein